MQEWRFDNLTRTLGKATTRRQVLKGLAGGLAAAMVGRAAAPKPAAAATGHCGDNKSCRNEAATAYQTCRANGGTWWVCTQQAVTKFKTCWDSPCPEGQQCCGFNCVDWQTDRNNCGWCGHSCYDPHAICVDGRCVCPDEFIQCEGGSGLITCCPPDTTCSTDLFGPAICKQNCDPECPICQSCDDGQCGIATDMDGVPCGPNKVCCNGQCVSGTECVCEALPDGATCDTDKVCCQYQCVSNQCPDPKVFDAKSCSCQCPQTTCPQGQVLDPDTCQCTTSCGSEANGTPCGTDQVCCNGQCVSNQCPSPKVFDNQSCSCQCPPPNCGTGEQQDPDSCECVPVDLCAKVTCADCEHCDPTNGACISTCSAGESCSTCRDANVNEWVGICCPNDQGCTTSAAGNVVCCPIDPATGIANAALPDGTCCSDNNHVPTYCDSIGWVCCDASQGDAACTCCGVCS